MRLYLASNTRPDISFAVQHCTCLTHITKASNETAVKMICRYLQGTKDNGLLFNPSNKLVVELYADADFAGLWGHEKLQDPICARSRTRFVVTFSGCPIFWMSELQTEIDISTLHYEYVPLYQYVRALLPLKNRIKEVIDNLGIDSEKLKFVLSSTVFEEHNGSIVLATSTIMTTTSKHIAVKYNWFRQHVGK